MSLFQKFSTDHRGSVPVIFAFALFPLVGVSGLAVDYARATQARSLLQSAADSTVLMLARQAPKNDQAALAALASPYFAAVFNKDSGLAQGALGVTKGTKVVTLTAQGTVKTTFGTLFGWSEWPISVAAASAYGTKKIEVALVLDNTGSMASSNKIGELKKASKTLVSILQDATTEPGQVKIAIVPYTTRVNLGASYRNETWLTNTPTGTFMSGYNLPATRAAWGGCVADRDAPHNRADSAVSVPVPQTLYPMVNCVDGLAQAQPLTDNWGLLNTRIDSMKASGMTNITLGAQWGFEMLSRNAPFSEATADPDVERFMILLTDGDNTQDRWGSWDVARMDKDTKSMCDAITERGVAEAAKVHRIRLYTVLVIAGNESLLKSCATKPEMFYKVNAASQLESVFKAIASEIGQVRLTM